MTKILNTYIFTCFLLILIYSCSNRMEIKSEYYENGKIKSKSYFNSDSTQSPYCELHYDKKGKLIDSLTYDEDGKLNGIIFNQKQDYCKWTNFNHGIRQGAKNVQLDNGEKVIQHYINDTLNGVEYKYNLNGILQREVLWVNDKPQIVKEIYHPAIGDTVNYEVIENQEIKNKTEIIKDSIEINIYKFIEKDTTIPFAFINLNKSSNEKVKITRGNYFFLESKDTIENGEDFHLNLKNHFGNIKNADWEIFIEKPYLKSKRQKYYFFPKVMNNAEIVVKANQLGYNYIWGLIKLKRDTMTLNQVWFYKDFYVKNK